MVLPLASASRAAVASGMGYASIGFWLFAQAPQVVKNYRLQSCDGLSLPFLCNWLFGDITNLIGCILTDQLPFQTYLAAYFCLVDFTLVIQFFHYKPPPAPRYAHLIHTSPHQSLLIHTAPPHAHVRGQSTHSILRSVRDSRDPRADPPDSANSAVTIRASRSAHPSFSYAPYHDHSHEHGEEYAATASGSSSVHATPQPEVRVISATPLPRDGSYQAIYEAALDVARAAERAEARRLSRSMSRPRRSRHQSATSANLPLVDEDASPPSHMFESFHSDMSAATSSSTASASARQRGVDPMSLSTPALMDHRGRSLRRTGTGLALNVPTPPMEEDGLDGLPGEGGHGVDVAQERARRNERSASRSLSLARGSSGRGKGRRAAGVAFMSLGLLAIGRGGATTRLTGSRAVHGVVLSSTSTHYSDSSLAFRHPYFNPQPPISQPIPDTTYILFDHHDPPSPPAIDYQHLIGRISAWACTTLYLTSRLPQIWKNFQRKSVEGLSILLFLFAFLGNTTYVASIVLNAPFEGEDGEASHYLLEALPYLLGSGGTLLFDLTIMLQSLIYGSAPPVHPPPFERASSLVRRPLFRRKTTRFVEDGHAPATTRSAHAHQHPHAHTYPYSHTHTNPHSPHSRAGTGERQPLLSGSILAESPVAETREAREGVRGTSPNVRAV